MVFTNQYIVYNARHTRPTEIDGHLVGALVVVDRAFVRVVDPPLVLIPHFDLLEQKTN